MTARVVIGKQIAEHLAAGQAFALPGTAILRAAFKARVELRFA